MIFISYSRTDARLVDELAERLEVRGMPCWVDRTNIPPGEAFVEMIANGLNGARACLFVDTPPSRTSYWVDRELSTAFHLRQQGLIDFCIRLGCPGYLRREPYEFDLDLPLGTDPTDYVAAMMLRKRGSVSSPKGSRRAPISVFNGTGLQQPQNWVGQQSALAQIDAWWAGAIQGCWITGHGGIGKTGLLQTWIAVLRHLRVPGPACSGIAFVHAATLSHQAVQNTVQHLRNLSQDSLLVVDGYDEARDTRTCDSLVESSAIQSRVLVTSRTAIPTTSRVRFHQLSLDGLRQFDASTMLVSIGVAEPIANELSAAVGHLPLAMQLLRSQILKGVPPEDLLIRLQRSTSDLEATNGPATMLHEAALRAMNSLSQGARQLLLKIAAAGDQGIESASLASQHLDELKSRALITTEATGSRVNTHPMVRRITLSDAAPGQDEA